MSVLRALLWGQPLLLFWLCLQWSLVAAASGCFADLLTLWNTSRCDATHSTHFTTIQDTIQDVEVCIRKAVSSAAQAQPPLPTSNKHHHTAHRTTVLLLSILIPAGVFALSMALLSSYKHFQPLRSALWRTFTRRQASSDRTTAAGGPPDVTLVVTDIEGSTTLWETLPDRVMDTAVKAHHAAIRQVLRRHSGQESATEGDSFILAFHNPADALSFCLEAQEVLLNLDWSPELLAMDICRPLHYRSMEEVGPAPPDPLEHLPARHLSRQVPLLENTEIQNSPSPQHIPWNLPASASNGARKLATVLSNRFGSRRFDRLLSNTPFRAKHQGAARRRATYIENPSPAALICTASVATIAAAAASASASQDGMQASRAASDEITYSKGSFSLLAGASGLRIQAEAGASQASGGLAIGGSSKQTLTFREVCNAIWLPCNVDDPAATLLFRGLRVRMGVHRGPDIMETSHRGVYSGEGLKVAKAVADAGQGGMVVVSDGVFAGLQMEALWDSCVLLHSGEHQLKGGCITHMYQAYQVRLRGRTAVLGPLRTQLQVSCGVEGAPMGHVAIAFLHLVGSSTLRAWNQGVFEAAFQMFARAAGGELRAAGGYEVELDDRLLLASFPSPKAAIMWALDLQVSLLDLDWPEELLGHELGEEMLYPSPLGQKVMFRGLRVKAGLDCGPTHSSVHAATGRITYRGRVMNRAARIAATATSGQILCSSDVWGEAFRAAASELRRVEAISLGAFRLKGIPDKMELLQCRFRTGRGRSARMSGVICTNVEEFTNPDELRQSNSSILDTLGTFSVAASDILLTTNSSHPQPDLGVVPRLPSFPEMRSLRRVPSARGSAIRRAESVPAGTASTLGSTSVSIQHSMASFSSITAAVIQELDLDHLDSSPNTNYSSSTATNTTNTTNTSFSHSALLLPSTSHSTESSNNAILQYPTSSRHLPLTLHMGPSSHSYQQHHDHHHLQQHQPPQQNDNPGAADVESTVYVAPPAGELGKPSTQQSAALWGGQSTAPPHQGPVQHQSSQQRLPSPRGSLVLDIAELEQSLCCSMDTITITGGLPLMASYAEAAGQQVGPEAEQQGDGVGPDQSH